MNRNQAEFSVLSDRYAGSVVHPKNHPFCSVQSGYVLFNEDRTERVPSERRDASHKPGISIRTGRHQPPLPKR